MFFCQEFFIREEKIEKEGTEIDNTNLKLYLNLGASCRNVRLNRPELTSSNFRNHRLVTTWLQESISCPILCRGLSKKTLRFPLLGRRAKLKKEFRYKKFPCRIRGKPYLCTFKLEFGFQILIIWSEVRDT